MWRLVRTWIWGGSTKAPAMYLTFACERGEITIAVTNEERLKIIEKLQEYKP